MPLLCALATFVETATRGKGFPDYGGVVIDWEREQDELRRRN
jgi:drug/metabolite transporter superfamily protein YnfA